MNVLSHRSVSQKSWCNLTKQKTQLSFIGWSQIKVFIWLYLPGNSEDGPASKFIQLFGKIQFLEVAGPKFIFLCWLSAVSLSQLLKATWVPCLMLPLPALTQQEQIKAFSWFWISSISASPISPLPPARESSLLLRVNVIRLISAEKSKMLSLFEDSKM